MKVLVACEFSGIVRDAFAMRGHNAWSCDLLPSEKSGQHIQGDCLGYLNDGWDLMIAHPPCTHLAISGARWFKNKQQEQKEAIDFFMQLVNAPVQKIAIENPVSIMSTIYRKPDQTIQPYEFGEPESKKTCLWLKNLPLLKPTRVVLPAYQSIFFESPGKKRGQNRSRMFQGIADAMADQWGKVPP